MIRNPYSSVLAGVRAKACVFCNFMGWLVRSYLLIKYRIKRMYNDVADVIKFSLALLSITAEFHFCFWRGTSFSPAKATSLLGTLKYFYFWLSENSKQTKIQKVLAVGLYRSAGTSGAGVSKPQGSLRDTKPKSQCVDGHSPLCCGVSSPCPSDRAVPSYFQLLFKNQTSVHFINIQVLEETQLHHFMSIQAIQMNRGNKGFSLYRSTSGLNVTVRSTISFNSAEILLCDSLLCSLITNSTNINSDISV